MMHVLWKPSVMASVISWPSPGPWCGSSSPRPKRSTGATEGAAADGGPFICASRRGRGVLTKRRRLLRPKQSSLQTCRTIPMADYALHEPPIHTLMTRKVYEMPRKVFMKFGTCQ